MRRNIPPSLRRTSSMIFFFFLLIRSSLGLILIAVHILRHLMFPIWNRSQSVFVFLLWPLLLRRVLWSEGLHSVDLVIRLEKEVQPAGLLHPNAQLEPPTMAMKEKEVFVGSDWSGNQPLRHLMYPGRYLTPKHQTVRLHGSNDTSRQMQGRPGHRRPTPSLVRRYLCWRRKIAGNRSYLWASAEFQRSVISPVIIHGRGSLISLGLVQI